MPARPLVVDHLVVGHVLETPVERPGGARKSVVEVIRLSEYLTRNALIIGEQAALTSVRWLVKKKRPSGSG